MSSYYSRVQGTLNTGQIANASDINEIQTAIQNMIDAAMRDVNGAAVVLGEDEDALKLEPTTEHIDQSNTDLEDTEGISFYGRYFKQPINIEKSSIESITVQLLNSSPITVTVHAEILNGCGIGGRTAQTMYQNCYNSGNITIDEWWSGGTYVTKGDANNSKDEPISKEQIVGKVVKIIPGFGIIRKTILNPIFIFLSYIK